VRLQAVAREQLDAMFEEIHRKREGLERAAAVAEAIRAMRR
jgi:hypothetical protein